MGDIVGRDKYEQKGVFPKISVDNRRGVTGKKWYEKWWGQILIGIIILVVGALILKLLNLA